MFIAFLLWCLVLFAFSLLLCAMEYVWSAAGNGRERGSSSVPPLIAARMFIFRRSLTIDRGLQPSVVSSIPVFVFGEDDDGDCGLECVICLSLFENGEKCRRLGLCRHAFHVECIDMWLHSHTTCPVCRALAVDHRNHVKEHNLGEFCETRVSNEDHGRLEIVVEDSNTRCV